MRGRRLHYNKMKRIVIWWAQQDEIVTICCSAFRVTAVTVDFEKTEDNSMKFFRIFMDYSAKQDKVIFLVDSKELNKPYNMLISLDLKSETIIAIEVQDRKYF